MSGELSFTSGIDNEQLKKDAAQASNLIKGIGNTAQAESARIDNSFSGIGKGLAVLGGTTAVTMIGKEILDTTAKFEKFGIVLKNSLGDVRGQESLDMISNFAATTPFQLDEVTAAFIKMSNQGFTPTREEMVKLGDLASTTGKSFDQLTEALLDAQTGQFERLKEFGIKASVTGDKVTFSFREQMTTVDNTNSAIQKYILSLGDLNGVQGANAKISASITGQLSNMGDKFAAIYNEIGSSNSGVIYSALGGINLLADNYETIGKTVMSLVAVYGAYKAAVIVTNAVNAVQAKIAYQQMLANIGNTGATVELTTAQGLQAVMASNLTRIQLALNKSMLANPYVLAAMAVTSLVIAMSLYANSAKEARTEKGMLNDLESESQKNVKGEVSSLDALKKILNDSNKSYGERKVALDKLKEIVPEYHASLTAEGNLINNNSEALNSYVKKLVIAEKLKLAAAKQGNAQEAFDTYKTDNADVLKNALKKKFNGEELFAGEAGALDKWTKLATEATNYDKVIEKLQGDLVAIDAKAVKKPTSKTPAQIKAEEAATRKAETAAAKEEKRLQNEADATLKLSAKTAEAALSKRQAELTNQQALDNLLEDGFKKKAALIEDDHKQELLNIDKRAAELLAKQQEVEKLAWEKGGKKGVFKPSTTSTAQLSEVDKKEISTSTTTANLKFAFDNKSLLDSLVDTYQSFNEKRIAIDKKFNEDMAALKAAKLVAGADVPKINSAIAVAVQYNTEDNAALDKQVAEKEVTFKGYVNHITALGLNEITSLLEKAKTTLQNSTGTDDDKAVMRAKIVALQEQLAALETNGGKDTKGNAKINEGLNKSKDTVEVLKLVGSEIDNVINEFSGMDDATKSALTAASNITMAVVGSILGIISLSKVGTEMIKGVERASIILAIIGAAISVITTIIGLFTSAAAKRRAEEKAAIESQRKEYLGLMDLNEELRKKYEWTKKIGESTLDYIKRQGEELKKQTSANAVDQADLMAKLQKQTYKSGTERDYNWFGGYKNVDVNSSLAGKTYAEIEALAAQGKLSKEGNDYFEALKKAKDEGVDLVKQSEEYFESLRELATGTTSSTIVDNIIEGFKAGKKSAADFADTFESLMQGAVQSALKQLTDTRVREWYVKFAAMSSDGLTPEEKASLQADWSKIITDTAKDAANLESATGVSITDTSATREASSKGFASMSQDSSNELNGRFTAMNGLMYNFVEGLKLLQSTAGSILSQVIGIKGDTARLENVENGIDAIKAGIEQINTKGINLKL